MGINWVMLAAIGLPLAGALQRLAVGFGYEGLSWHEACEQAYRVGMTLAIISCVFMFAYGAEGPHP